MSFWKAPESSWKGFGKFLERFWKPRIKPQIIISKPFSPPKQKLTTLSCHRMFPGDHGADVNLGGRDGITPLQIATDIGDLDVIELLLRNGAR
ncbi:hypothetical protein Trydic_g19791 [Trypoxylus dichotomus]